MTDLRLISDDHVAIEACSDTAVVVRWPGLESGLCRRSIHCLLRRVHERYSAQGVFAVPGFDSLTIHFQPLQTDVRQLCESLRQLACAEQQEVTVQRLVTIPMCVSSDFAPDLEALSSQRGLSVDAALDLFCATEFVVQLIGFAPGFPYLAGLPEELHAPRRATPRLSVAAGSIAIGGAQAGIYPQDLPGGWNVIGRTPIRMFDEQRQQPCLLEPGDRVRFDRITRDEFNSLRVER